MAELLSLMYLLCMESRDIEYLIANKFNKLTLKQQLN